MNVVRNISLMLLLRLMVFGLFSLVVSLFFFRAGR